MPIRITNNDRKNEQEVVRYLERKLEADIIMTDDMDDVDFVVCENDVATAIIELKSRNVLPDTYNTIYLSKSKREKMETIAEEYGIMPIFMVRFKDKSIKMILLGKDVNLGRATRKGRFDRGDKNDIEMMYEVPITDMEDI